MIDMKFYLFILLIIFNHNLSFANPESIMKKANEHFIAGDYNKSIELYEELVSNGFNVASLNYNLANAYYRTGKIGLAILYYERAKQIDPSDEDINHNLNFVRLQTKDKIEKLPEFFLFEWWESALCFFNVNQLTIVAYILFILIIISLIYYTLSKDYKIRRFSFYSSVILVIPLIVSIVLLAVNLNREFTHKYGIILSKSAVVKSSPDPESKDAFIIHEGLKVKIEDGIDNWYKIKLEDGKVGWIDKVTLSII